ncbi:LacI family DNA-binding transcriptional regulator [Klugiella xanthotipulae]|uniref:LacI family transcriptional regulator n=1 Tax=Klugiella xanthotipulae TaxID=244735 RepID=A0A543I726_9MICO|nr:LacI family DNA-binding transcriptional regulator [Klugiella xanthotipulae]TQM66355.1 LacI family transcriptional regulator [Klugiella xanthotipulae]
MTSSRQAAGSPARRVTLADVARLAGVSTSTVSIAFGEGGPVSDAMRLRVHAAAAELGYTGPDPRAASLRRGRSGLIGVVLEERLGEAFRDPVRISLLDGIAEEVGAAGSGLALLGDVAAGPLSIATAPVDAVILFGCSTGTLDSIEQARRRGLPLVELEGRVESDVFAVDSDNRGASRAAAQHLYDLGHRRVATLTLPLDRPRVHRALAAADPVPGHNFVAVERLLGVREVFPEAHTIVCAASLVEEGRVAGHELLGGADAPRYGEGGACAASARPTAIIAQSDLLALGMIRAAGELGLRVPADVSVIGFDGIRLDGLSDRDLSTMIQPAQEKGRAAGRAALALVAGEQPERLRYHSVLHAGDTTGPVPDP